MKVLSFDIYGNFGHFRKFWTTSSPLTFSFPPPTTVGGIMGAIVGNDKNNKYISPFRTKECKLSIKIVNPIKKIIQGLNLINTKISWDLNPKNCNKTLRTRINFEFLTNPRYTIYFNHSDESLFENVVELVKESEYYFPVSLGLSECLANIEYNGVYNATKYMYNKEEEFIEILTPISTSNFIKNNIKIESNKKYLSESKIPIKMNLNREIEKYDTVIYEATGASIKAKIKEYYSLENGENIVFF